MFAQGLESEMILHMANSTKRLPRLRAGAQGTIRLAPAPVPLFAVVLLTSIELTAEPWTQPDEVIR